MRRLVLRALRRALQPHAAVVVLIGAAGPLACAGQGDLLKVNVQALESRVAELETANRHLVVRNDALEDKLALVEDQLHSLTLSQRQLSRMDDLEVVRLVPDRSADPYSPYDDPADPAYDPYGTPYPAAGAAEPDGPYEDIVISDEKIRRYLGDSALGAEAPTPGKAKRTYVPKPDVVRGDRLPVAPLKRESASSAASRSKAQAKASPTALYEEGLQLYRKGMFKPAIEKFEAFLAGSPPRDYVDNALYWLGDCHYGLGAYAEAAAYFHRIVQEHPDANKVPDALLKVGLTYLRLQKSDSAREVLYYLIEAFPETEAARVARNRLDSVEKR